MKIVILGAGVQGSVFGVRLALAGHEVTLVARPQRAALLRREGATIQDAKTMLSCTKALPVLERLPPDFIADLCLVTVRREQIEAILPDLARATAIPRIVLLINHANGSNDLLNSLGPSRTVLAFPGIAGYRDGLTIRYLDIPQQPTVVDKRAHAIVALLRKAGLRVNPVADMDAWLQRHAVFITAMAGALYQNDCSASRLARNPETIRRFILAVRQGWKAQDRRHLGPAPFALRSIMCWVPLPFSVKYWSRLLASPDGEIYFARHTRHASAEMAALAADLRDLLREGAAPMLQQFHASIDHW